MKPIPLSAADLLLLEIETLWSRDDYGRLTRDRGLNGFPAPHAVIGCAARDQGQVVAIGQDVPRSVAAEIEAIVASSAPSKDAAAPPPALSLCEALLAPVVGPVEVSSGPSYVAVSVPEFSSGAEMRTDSAGSAGLPAPPEEARWTAEEWRLLTTGALGPWAMALIAGEIVAICFCACLTDAAAEAGVWTHPDHRGRGHASAATSAWAALVLGTGRHAFYSTSSDNASSQAVAGRLGLRPIGWMWKLGRSVRTGSAGGGPERPLATAPSPQRTRRGR